MVHASSALRARARVVGSRTPLVAMAIISARSQGALAATDLLALAHLVVTDLLALAQIVITSIGNEGTTAFASLSSEFVFGSKREDARMEAFAGFCIRNLPKDGDPNILKEEILLYFKSFGYVARIAVKTDLDEKYRGFVFVIFADRSVDSSLANEHPIWDIKRKRDLPMYVEREDRASHRMVEPPVRSRADLRFPCVSSDDVILFGEGDFSYAATAIDSGKLGPSHAVSTSMNSPRDQCHINKLRASCVECLIDVDVTCFVQQGYDCRFDVAVINFPHTGEPAIEANGELLNSFFAFAGRLLRRGGRAAIALKQTWPYTE